MPDVWGEMPKSALDDQLIDEAITEAIEDHEADSGAHADTGESINIHEESDPVRHEGVYPLKVLSSDPEDPSEGWLYFNSTDGKPKVYDGTSWQTLDYV